MDIAPRKENDEAASATAALPADYGLRREVPATHLSLPAGFDRFRNELLGVLRAARPNQLELLPAHLVVGNEKMLEFLEQVGVHVAERMDVLVIVRIDGDGHQPIVSRALASFGLLGLDY